MYSVLRSVAKHFVVYGFGTVLQRIVAFILIPLYTHYLTTSDYGTLELLDLSTSVVGMFLAVGISYSVLRFYFDSDDPKQRYLVVSTANLSILFLAFALGSWLIVFAPSVSSLVFGSPDNGGLFRITFLSLILAVVSEVPLIFIRAQQKSLLYTTISLTRFALSFVVTILYLVVFKWGMRGIILSNLTTQLLSTIVVVTYAVKETGLAFSWSKLKEMIGYGLPYIPGGVGRFILNFADRFLLQRMASLSDVGIYALGYKFGMVLNPLVSEPFESIWGPKMFEVSNREDATRIYATVFTYFIFLEMFVGLGIAVLAKDALAVMSTPAYHSAYGIVPIILLSYIIWGACSHVQVGILLQKQTRFIAYAVGIGAAANLALNYMTIPFWGMWGAAVSTLLSFFVLFLLTYRMSQRFLRVHYEFGRVLKLLSVAILIYLGSLMIDLGALWATILVKVVMVLAFPAAMILVRFFTSQEEEKIKELLLIARSYVAQRLGRAKS